MLYKKGCTLIKENTISVLERSVSRRTFPLELYGVLRDGIVEVGGFDNPTHISSIQEGTGDSAVSMTVFEFDTYV